MKTNKLYSPSIIKELEQTYGYHTSKRLGQNFLIDQNITLNIIKGAGICENDLVIEIGSGAGGLTAVAAAKAALITAVEIDGRLIPALKDNLSNFDNINIINGDILKIDIAMIAALMKAEYAKRRQSHNGAPDTAQLKIIGNLPYYITTAIITKLLEDDIFASGMTFMMQKEVANRICARNGERDSSAITALIRYHSNPVPLFNVSREVFIPKPNVDSTVVRFDILSEKSVSPTSESFFFKVIRAGFNQRRKTLLNALAGFEGLGKDEIQKAFAIAELAPTRRAESLTLVEFERLSDALLAIND